MYSLFCVSLCLLSANVMSLRIGPWSLRLIYKDLIVHVFFLAPTLSSVRCYDHPERHRVPQSARAPQSAAECQSAIIGDGDAFK
jgi:hypothetical protein